MQEGISVIIVNWLLIVLVLLYLAMVAAAVVMVVKDNRNPIRALAWVIALIFLPGVGVIFYLFFGRSLKGMHMISQHQKRRLLHDHKVVRVDLDTLHVSRDTRNLIKLAHNICRSPLTIDNRIDIFTDGLSKFNALKEDLRHARKSIFLQYYIFLDDGIGQQIADILIEKAAQGLEVKVIYDNVGSFKASNSFFRRLNAAGVDTHPFFRVTFPELANRINWRNHRKIVVIDEAIAYVGGMNIADRYVRPVDGKPEWRDTHFRLQGNIVESCIYSFAVDWNFMKKAPQLSPIECRPADFHNELGMQLITSGPVDTWDNIALCFLKCIAMAKRSIYIQTPYFLPTDALLRALEAAALSKIDVRIMIPEHSDSRMLQYASFSYVTRCLNAGIKVYLYTRSMLHAKCMIIDDDVVTAGSTNFDFRSFENNFECNLLIYDRDFNARMRDIFFNDIKQSRKLTYAKWHARPKLQRLTESVVRLFAPIL